MKRNQNRSKTRQGIAAATVYTLPYKQQKVQYMHQTFLQYKSHTQALTSFAGHAQRQDEKAQRGHKKYATKKER